MDRQAIIDRLTELPKEIAKTEHELYTLSLDVKGAKEELMRAENQLYLDGKIDGKNAEVRAAQLKESTIKERNAIHVAENKVELARIKLNELLNEFRAYRTIARILEAEVV